MLAKKAIADGEAQQAAEKAQQAAAATTLKQKELQQLVDELASLGGDDGPADTHIIEQLQIRKAKLETVLVLSNRRVSRLKSEQDRVRRRLGNMLELSYRGESQKQKLEHQALTADSNRIKQTITKLAFEQGKLGRLLDDIQHDVPSALRATRLDAWSELHRSNAYVCARLQNWRQLHQSNAPGYRLLERVRCLFKLTAMDKLLIREIETISARPDFERLSLKVIRAKIGESLGQDMTKYKARIKELVIKVISA